MAPLALALAGAVLLWLPAFRFRIDAVTCAVWPAHGAGAFYALAYVGAVALLTAGWLRALRADWSLRRVLVAGALVHAVAMVAPPFASNDPLFYSALGRALHRFHASAGTSLSLTLPAGDPFLAPLPESWRAGTSAYCAGFNQLTAAVDALAGDSLFLHLRLFQALNGTLLVAAAALVGLAFGPRAATLLLLAPLAVVDGTVNPHNDALLAVATAAFALALSRRREAAGLLALAAALLVKMSGALLFVFEVLRLMLRPIATRLRASTVLWAGVALAVTGVTAIVVAARAWPEFGAFAALFGDPLDPYPRISRSVEALPRALLTYIVHAPLWSWRLGLVFRGAGAVWLLYCAFCAARELLPLRWAAIMLFGYFLFLHGYLQSWYLLPLLTLATQLPEWMQRPLRIFVVCATAYYALHLPLDCDLSPVVIGAKELCEAALVILPAAVTLLAAWRRRARACDGTSPRAA
jgi:hypothetical protein